MLDSKTAFLDIQRVPGTDLLVLQTVMDLKMVVHTEEGFEIVREMNFGDKVIDSFELFFEKIYVKLDNEDDVFLVSIGKEDLEMIGYSHRRVVEQEREVFQGQKIIQNFEDKFSYISSSVYDEMIRSNQTPSDRRYKTPQE